MICIFQKIVVSLQTKSKFKNKILKNMARLTIFFIKKDEKGERKTVKTVEIVAKKVKTEDYNEAYYCHKNPYGINWVVLSVTREHSKSWNFSIDPLHTKDGVFMSIPNNVNDIHVRVN